MEPEEASGDPSSTHFENNRKALLFPDSCNEILQYENSSCTTPCTSKNHVCDLECELALQWPEGKHLGMQKHCIWINHQERKQSSEISKIYLNILF